jgi:hypothetical protein
MVAKKMARISDRAKKEPDVFQPNFKRRSDPPAYMFIKPEHFVKIFKNQHYGEEYRRLELLWSVFQPVQFVTETFRALNYSDSDNFSRFGRADLAASAALRWPFAVPQCSFMA